MLDFLHEEKRNLDFILDPKVKIFDWQLELLCIDLTSLQRTLLIRHRCRDESFQEIAEHLGMKTETISSVFSSLMNRLTRYRKSLDGKIRWISEHGLPRKGCRSCGSSTARRRSEFCDSCTPRSYTGYFLEEDR